jgi:hypothetical protein
MFSCQCLVFPSIISLPYAVTLPWFIKHEHEHSHFVNPQILEQLKALNAPKTVQAEVVESSVCKRRKRGAKESQRHRAWPS